MIHAERMAHVTVVAPKHYMEKVINKLYELGVYHIEEHKKSEKADIGKPLEKGEKLAEILVKIRAIISYLGIEESQMTVKSREVTEKDYYELGKKSKELYLDVVRQLDTIKNSEQHVQELTHQLRLLDIAKRLHLKMDILKNAKIITHLVGNVDNLDRLHERLTAITTRYDLTSAKNGKKHLVAVFFEESKRDAIQFALHEAGFVEISLAGLEQREGDTIEKLQKKMTMLNGEKQAAQQKLKKIRNEYQTFLLQNEHMLAEESKKAEAPLKFGTTERAFMINGWVPKKKIQQVTHELNKITGEKVYVEIEEPTSKDTVPIKLRHSRPVKPFEFLTQLYELPSYHEIDPTILLFLTFPLFFGIMLGDVGYGLVTSLLFLFLRKKIPSGKALFNILIFASILSIGFGFVFGEYFGFEHVSLETGKQLCATGVCLHVEEIDHQGEIIKVATFPRLMSRVESHMNVFGYDVLSILVIGAIIGFIHLNLGLLIGFLNALHHGFVHAFFEKISWMIMEAGVILLVLSTQGMVAFSWLIGAIVLLLGVVGIYLGDGVQGLVELPAIFSNMLSYMRLGAVGLASVGLAVVVNENLALPMIEKGGVFIVIGMLIFLVGHVINIGLGVLGPFLHALRLHYVEFFTKFYRGGGVEYAPFGTNETKG